MKSTIVILFFGLCVISSVSPVKPDEKEIVLIGHFKCSGKLQDAGDFDSPKLRLDQLNKLKALKLESDKYR